MPMPDDTYAQCQVGFMYVTGYDGQKNLNEEFKWLRGFAA